MAYVKRSQPLKPEVRLAQSLSEFQAGLPSKDRAAFAARRAQALNSPPTPHDVMRLVASIDHQPSGKNGGRCFGPRFTHFLQDVQQFATLGDVVLGGSLNFIACGVWSAVQLSLLAVSSFPDYNEIVSAFFMEMGLSTPNEHSMALLYPQSEMLQSYLFGYFIVVVRLCDHLFTFTQKSTFEQSASIFIDAGLETLREELGDWRRLVQEVKMLMTARIDEEAPPLLQPDIAQCIQYLVEKHRLLDSCSTYAYETTWRQNRRIGNAAFFKQNAEYRQWRSSSTSCTMLWTGEKGSEKSVLLASIVDDLHARMDNENITVAYFFCRPDVPKSLKARTILGSLARQLLLTAADDAKVAQLCGEASPTEDTEEVINLLLRGLTLDRKSYFILDGLDACEFEERNKVIEGFGRLQGTLTLLLCLSSRPGSNKGDWIATRLTIKHVVVIPESNPDVEAFIEAELERCLLNGSLILGDSALILEIRDALLQSRRPFGWVAHQIRQLCDIQTDQEIRNALASFLAEPSEIVAQNTKDEDPILLSKGMGMDWSSDGSSSESPPGSYSLGEGSRRHGAFSSTLPTSQGTGNDNLDGGAVKVANLDLRDSDTIFSIDTVPEDSDYVLMFAHRLLHDLKNESGLADIRQIPSSIINDAIGLFTWKLYEESKDPFQWETSVILHRKINKIVNVLTGTELEGQEEDSDDESRTPFVKSHDHISSWVAGISALDDEGSQQLPAASNMNELQLPQLGDYESFIDQSHAYRWLLSKICQHRRLLFGDSNVMATIGTQILCLLQAQPPLHRMSRRRPLSLANVTFAFDWKLKAFINYIGSDSYRSGILDKVSCLTGTWCEAQVMTVPEYIRQTWPVTGESIMALVQDLIAVPEGYECHCPLTGTKGAHISAHLLAGGRCTISVTAGPHLISELAEQIAWLVATLQIPPSNEAIVTCRPRIKSLSVSDTQNNTAITTYAMCSLSFDFEDELAPSCNESGFCWGLLFRNPILVTGFPILRRPGQRMDLEMSLGMMSILIQSDQLVQYGDRIMIKGYSSLLLATSTVQEVVLWHHLVSGRSGERISYFDDRIETLDTGDCHVPSLRSLESLRHIVGWCAKATDFCGHETSVCTISASGLRPLPPSTVMDRMYIEGGMYVVGGVSFRPNQKEQPIKLHRRKNYLQLLQMLAAHPMAFYDVADRRAWLVDGASALLYLVRVSLHLDATDPESVYDWIFDSKMLKDTWGSCTGRAAALETLKSWEHRNLPLYVKDQSIRDGKVMQEFSTFGDRVDEILYSLEVLIDRDIYLASQDGIKVSQTLDRRKGVPGFDLLDLIKPFGPIGMRIAPVETWGNGWVDLFPAIGVTTIFGKGFSNLIRPADLDQVCSGWKSVPIGKDYMTASISTLKMIHTKRLLRLTPNLGYGELTSNIVWTSPCHPSKSCGCISSKATIQQKHLNPLQFLVSKKSWNPSRKLKNASLVDVETLDDAGAVVFANLSLLGRSIDTNIADHVVEQAGDDAPVAVPSSSSQASVPLTGTSSTTQSTSSTIPSAASKEPGDQSQKHLSKASSSKHSLGMLRRKFNSLLKK